jgi:hypothetical protein
MRTNLHLVTLAFVISCLVPLVASTTHASVNVFSGGDPGVSPPGPWPNSDNAAAAFDSATLAVETESIITFESVPVAEFSSLTVAPGVALSGVNITGGTQAILNAPAFTPSSLYGFNTTAGGSRFVYLVGGHITFTFATPIDSFGAYFTGVQLSGETITFNDGSAQSLGITDLGSGAQFVGFTDAGKLISSVMINAGNGEAGDNIGVDDVRYVSAVPEPSTWLLLACSLVALHPVRPRRP